MVRFLTRIPFARAFLPRVAAPLLPTTARSAPLTGTHRPTRLFHNFPARLNQAPSPERSPSTPPNATVSQRLKFLIRSYGWYALGVYLALSALDFAVAFAGINLLGAEYVSRIAISVKESIAHVLHSRPLEPGRDEMDAPYRHGNPSGHEGLYAMLVLAYTVHKTLFLPVRVGLTAALTPRLVLWLTRRGWVGSEGTKRAAQEMRERIRDRRRSND